MPLKDRVRDVLRRRGLMGPWWLLSAGPPRTDGWLQSVRRRESVDARGEPLPWITYPAIDFLSRCELTGLRVFEWGSGNSTRWWASRAREVHSCEHDAEWFAKIRQSLPPNCTLYHRSLDKDEEYLRSIADAGGGFDLVVIDGRQRVACSRACVGRLNPEGVILWDNTDREEYRPGLEELRSAGFHRVDFWGIAPMLHQKTCTSLLFPSRNCLGI